MKWNKKYYKEIKKFVSQMLRRPVLQGRAKDSCYEIRTYDDPLDFALTFLPLMVSAAEREDFEGAQATKDAIIEFINEFLPAEHQIPMTAGFKLEGVKKIKPEDITCILCYAETELTSRAEWIVNGHKVSE